MNNFLSKGPLFSAPTPAMAKITMAIAALTTALGFTSLGQQVPPADPGTASFQWIQSAIVQPKCVECHSSFATYQGLRAHVSPGYPENSIFFTALGDGQSCQMPQSMNNAPIQCVGMRGLRAVYWWIKAGAPQN